MRLRPYARQIGSPSILDRAVVPCSRGPNLFWLGTSLPNRYESSTPPAADAAAMNAVAAIDPVVNSVGAIYAAATANAITAILLSYPGDFVVVIVAPIAWEPKSESQL